MLVPTVLEEGQWGRGTLLTHCECTCHPAVSLTGRREVKAGAGGSPPPSLTRATICLCSATQRVRGATKAVVLPWLPFPPASSVARQSHPTGDGTPSSTAGVSRSRFVSSVNVCFKREESKVIDGLLVPTGSRRTIAGMNFFFRFFFFWGGGEASF